ncbi:MAG TPA: DUF3857 domain-containing protein [Flavihumibacter sp.]|jgi:hypothetical protein
MKKFAILYWLALSLSVAPALLAEYPSFTIPGNLLKYANAVVRKQEVVLDIQSEGKTRYREHIVLTVLNEAGARYAFWTDIYDKFSSIERMEGHLYNAAGKKIRSLKKNEVEDFPLYGAGQMVMDGRRKYHSFEYKEYPYTVEYISETVNTQTMFLPNWAPVMGRNLAVEQSIFTIISDPDYSYRTKLFNYPDQSVKGTSGKRKTETWAVKNLPAIPSEYGAPPIHEVAPYVALGASTFKLGNFKGDMSTWIEYGKFMAQLIEGQDQLPDFEKQKVAEIVAGCSSDREKVEKLYRYMQSKTHYVGIQLGIGGWKPFPASYVATKGYGDCKALSNYMVALLKEAGIKSYYALIRAGSDERDIPVDFPAFYFNHVVCAVPLQKDTIWLECVSQTQAPGYMGSFSGNRYTLLITEDGGVLARTPTYSKKENSYVSTIKGELNKDGQLIFQAYNRYSAMPGDAVHDFIHRFSDEEKKRYLQGRIDLPQFTVTNFSYREEPGMIPQIEENLSIRADHYAQFTGKRLFIIPNVLNRWDHKISEDTSRQYDIILREEKTETDTVRITIPDGYTIERGLKEINLETPFGIYKASAVIEGNTLVYTRRLELSKGRFPAKAYPELRAFYEKMYQGDRTKMVLVKAE